MPEKRKKEKFEKRQIKSELNTEKIEEFRRILVPVNGSKESLRNCKKALMLAKRLGIAVLVIYGIRRRIFADILPTNQINNYKYNMDLENSIEEEAHSFLNNIEKMGHEIGVNVLTMIVESTPDKEIMKAGKKNDLIIIGHKRTSATDRIFLRSVSEKVIHKSSSTVMIVR
jgi:nucleotide-binding universal stress UspA family protein